MNDNELAELRKTLRRMQETKPHESIELTGYHAKIVLKYIDELKGESENEQINNNWKPDARS